MRTHVQTLRRLEHLNRAAESGTDPVECAARRWECWMLLGEFESAWRESDFIAGALSVDPHRFWSGENWSGRRVMLRCLHGLGDAIQFIRYAPMLRETCAELIVQTHPELVRLLSQVPGIDQVVSWGPDYREDITRWDIQMEVMELPRVFRTTLSEIPAEVPYIKLPVAAVPPGGEWRVGVVWESSAWNTSRSVPRALRDCLLQTKGCRFFSLQKDRTSDAIDVFDTAVLMTQLDLVITVDTMTAHLAGALGIPVWIMLPFEADWRWMLERSDSPWYPSARLFRQNQKGSWEAVIQAVESQLKQVCCRRSSEYFTRGSFRTDG